VTTEKLKVLLVDDVQTVSEAAASSIRSVVGDAADVVVLPSEKTKQAVDALFERYRKSFIAGATLESSVGDVPSVFDDVDVLVLDYDLHATPGTNGEWASGLEVARMARVFSGVSAVVLLNQFRGNRFDLTMIEGTNSWADLDVNRKQIANPGLWSADGFRGYRPWHWPNLLTEPARFEALVDWLAFRMDGSVLPSIGLNADGAGKDERAVPRDVWAQLKIDPEHGTFRQLVENAGYLPSDEHNGRLANDPKAGPRVAAAVLRRWLERIVFPMQDTLVDAPHLAYLMPWLLRTPTELDAWNSTCVLSCGCERPFAVELGSHRLEPEFLGSRPVYFYRQMQDDEKCKRAETGENVPELDFCEDVSSFVESRATRSFPCLLPGSYTLRRVTDVGALKNDFSDARDTGTVDYLPQSLFAL
jgi:hypothetical protein